MQIRFDVIWDFENIIAPKNTDSKVYYMAARQVPGWTSAT